MPFPHTSSLWNALLIGFVCVLSYPAMAEEPDKAQDKKIFSFGVVPQQAARKIVRLWTPVLAALSKKSGHRMHVVTARDIPTFEKQLANGGYDFSYMNPYHFTVFHENPGYQAVARQKEKRIQGILVTRKDSPLQTLEDLRGRTLAFPSPAAFAASVLPRGSLRKAGIDVTPTYVSSHDSVYLTVARGLFPAGGGVVRTFRNTLPATRAQLRIFWKSDRFTPHAIAVHPRIPQPIWHAVQQALLEMGQDPQTRPLLEALKFQKGFEVAHNEDWDDVRALQLPPLGATVSSE